MSAPAGPKLTDWKRGDDVRSRAHHQEPVDALRMLLGKPNAGLGRIRSSLRKGGLEVLFGTIVAAGPNAEADWTDERHWVQVNFFDGADTDTDQVEIQDDRVDEGSAKRIYTGIFLPAVADHSHSLAVGDKVALVPIWTSGDPQVKSYLIIPLSAPPAAGSSGVSLMEVTALLTGAGFYELEFIQHDASVDVTTMDTDADDFSVPLHLGLVRSDPVTVIGMSLLDAAYPADDGHSWEVGEYVPVIPWVSRPVKVGGVTSTRACYLMLDATPGQLCFPP